MENDMTDNTSYIDNTDTISNKKALSKDDSKIGRRIRIARFDTGLTQRELANHIGVSTQQLQKYEWGTNRITAKTLYKIALFCERTTDWFVEDLAPTSLHYSLQNSSDPNFTIYASRYLRMINDKDTQEKILSIIKMFAKGEKIN